MKRKTKKADSKDSKQEKIKELKDQLARALADYDNLKKRVERERQELGTLAKVRLVSNLLPAFDMFAEVQAHLNNQGLAIAIQSLDETLGKQGFEKIKPEVGGQFNEKLHEVVEVGKVKGRKEGEILAISLDGWKTNSGLLIRPAKVKVNQAISEKR